MRNQTKKYFKSLALMISVVAIMLCLSACKNTNENLQDNDQSPVIEDVEQTPIEQTVFEKNVAFLTEKGLKLPELSSNNVLTAEAYLSLLVEAYETLVSEVDISIVNPNYEASDIVKKLSLINVVDNSFLDDDTLTSNLDYGSAAYWLFELQDEIQRRLYVRSDSNAIASDLLVRVNTSTALHTWKSEADAFNAYTISDLLEEQVALEAQLTRLQIAEMLVKAYEAEIGEEIQADEASVLTDTDNIYALKSNEFFFWTETGLFNPEEKGSWEDRSFMSAIIYDSQLRLALNLEETSVPYGAIVSALVTMINSYALVETNAVEEKIVLNERPYDWYVSQQETGEYSDVNCMPATALMALKYQGIFDVPTVEELRLAYPQDGQGWYDLLAEEVMLQYGLSFTASFEDSINIDKMISELDGGNVLYVMYREEYTEIGHSVIIKGYSKLGDKISFIVNDPNDSSTGPFGYNEYVRDAEVMKADIERHLTRYFIIPAGN